MRSPSTRFVTYVVAFGLLVAPLAARQDARSAPASVAGDWNVSIHGDHVMQTGLSLRQEGTKVTGTYHMQGKSAAAEGEFVDGNLTLTVDASIAPEHARKAGVTSISIVATMKEDGTLEGEMRSGRGPIRITAERFLPKRLDPIRAQSAAAGR